MTSSAGAIRAGRAFVELYINDETVKQSLEDVKVKLKTFGAAVDATAAASFTRMSSTAVASTAVTGTSVGILAATMGVLRSSVYSVGLAFRSVFAYASTSVVKATAVLSGLSTIANKFFSKSAFTGFLNRFLSSNETSQAVGRWTRFLGQLSGSSALKTIGNQIERIGLGAMIAHGFQTGGVSGGIGASISASIRSAKSMIGAAVVNVVTSPFREAGSIIGSLLGSRSSSSINTAEAIAGSGSVVPTLASGLERSNRASVSLVRSLGGLKAIGGTISSLATKVGGLAAAISVPALLAARKFAKTSEEMIDKAKKDGVTLESLIHKKYGGDFENTGPKSAEEKAEQKKSDLLERLRKATENAEKSHKSKLAQIRADAGMSDEQKEAQRQARLDAIRKAGLDAPALAQKKAEETIAKIREAAAVGDKSREEKTLAARKKISENAETAEKKRQEALAKVQAGGTSTIDGEQNRQLALMARLQREKEKLEAKPKESVDKNAKKSTSLVSVSDIKAAAEVSDLFDKLKRSTAAAWAQIGAAALPIIKSMTENMILATNAVGLFLSQNRQLITTIVSMAAKVASIAAAVAVLGNSFSMAIPYIAAMLSPLGLATAAIAGIAYAFPTIRQEAVAVFSFLFGNFVYLGKILDQTMQGMADALAGGSLRAAANVLWSGLNLAWLKGTEQLRDVYRTMITNIASMGIDLWSSLQSSWTVAMQFLGDAWDVVMGGMVSTWTTVQNSLARGLARIIAGITGQNVEEVLATLTEMQEFDAKSSKEKRDANLSKREKEAKRRLEEIEKRRKEDQGGNTEEDEARRKQAEKDLDKAQKEFDAAKKAAANAKGRGRLGAGLAASSSLKDSASLGTFSTAVVGRQTIGGFKELQNMDKNLQIIADAAEKGGGLAWV